MISCILMLVRALKSNINFSFQVLNAVFDKLIVILSLRKVQAAGILHECDSRATKERKKNRYFSTNNHNAESGYPT
jgi:hypothetical protein